MPVLSPEKPLAERPLRRAKSPGRESTKQNLSIKLTDAEHRAVEEAAGAEGKATGEWLRDLALRNLRSHASNAEVVALSEIIGVRLLLVNVLRPLGTGDKLTPAAFDGLLDEIGRVKHELARKFLSESRR
jgi:hypothetical protein